MSHKKITIAIDGFSSCGKSTLAKQLAKELDYIFIDSGAMYRAVTLYVIRNGAVIDDQVKEQKVIELLPTIDLRFELNQTSKSPEILLNDENVESEIRKPEISALVSSISAIGPVREKLVAEQRKMGKNGGIVMDGRDIGSVVFPNAELKLFITASIDIRVKRRHKELSEKGITISEVEVRENLLKRDHIDSTREISPLKQTEDAVVIDNTHLTRTEQLNKAKDLVEDIILSYS